MPASPNTTQGRHELPHTGQEGSMIQASERWVHDRLGAYITVTMTTEYVSPKVGELLLRTKDNALFSMLIGRTEIAALLEDLTMLLTQMYRETREHP
jgi:hypothetical protein